MDHIVLTHSPIHGHSAVSFWEIVIGADVNMHARVLCGRLLPVLLGLHLGGEPLGHLAFIFNFLRKHQIRLPSYAQWWRVPELSPPCRHLSIFVFWMTGCEGEASVLQTGKLEKGTYLSSMKKLRLKGRESCGWVTRRIGPTHSEEFFSRWESDTWVGSFGLEAVQSNFLLQAEYSH